jgi:ABC-type antimicrobial peptide transport system permease subunit
MRLAAIGGLVGLGGAWAMASLLGAVLIGVAPHDPWAFGGAVLLILAAAAAASAGPARRAARIDPIVALRAQ